MSDKKITRVEVAGHHSAKSLWFVIGNKVYDVTKFIDKHPGGCEVLLEQAGKDATKAFEDIGHSTDARKMMEDYFVGNLAERQNQAATTTASSKPITEAMAGGMIRLEVPKLAELKEDAKSPKIWIAGLPWFLCVTSTQINGKNLALFISCNSESADTNWRCDCIVTFTLLAQKADHKPYSKTFPRAITLKFESKSSGFQTFMNWDDVLNLENGFISDDGGIVIEASITVNNVIGVQSTPLCDFTAPQKNITDVVLLIGDKRLHVGKQFLATFSPIFYAKFYKDSMEMEKEEIKLDKVVFEEFVELLHVIYPTRKPVTAETVECLLRLGDRFMMEVVVRECAQFLCGPESNGISCEKKLLFADKYRLGRVQFLCLESLKTVEEVISLKGKREYSEFSGDMKAALFERISMLTCSQSEEVSQCS